MIGLIDADFISNKNISNVIRHKTVTAGGYLWEII